MLRLIEQHREAIIALCRKYGVTRLEVFGSAARDGFVHGSSDIDFFYDIDRTPLQGLADRFFAFHEELEALLGCQVDLVSRKDASNPHFLSCTDRDRTLLYAA